jgi:hypothetical protein
MWFRDAFATDRRQLLMAGSMIGVLAYGKLALHNYFTWRRVEAP